MAAKHILSLEIPEVVNCEIFTIKDTSQYADNLNVDCGNLQVLYPGGTIPVVIKLNKEFNMNFNTCSFELTTTGCETSRASFPDGIYVIRYSVAPHDKSYVEYNYLRVSSIMSTYYDKLCELDVQPCEPSSEKQQLLAEMSYIRTLIDAAKAKVEYCHSPSEGIELYNFAK